MTKEDRMNAKLEKIIKKYDGTITGLQDLKANEPPSKLFYIIANHLSYLLDTDPEVAISAKGVKRRRKLHFIIKNLGSFF